MLFLIFVIRAVPKERNGFTFSEPTTTS